MKHRFVFKAFLSSICLTVSAGCSPTVEAEGDHHAPAHAELDPLSTTVFGERVLLFMEFPPLVRGESARFLAHLSVLANGEPVRSGRVTLTIGASTLSAEAPEREGLFIPAGSISTPGRFTAKLTVESEQAVESLELGEFVVHASHDDAHAAAESAGDGAPPNAMPFLMEQQWKIKLLLAKAEPRVLVQRLIVPGQARTPEGSAASVSTTVGGRLSAPSGGILPRTGDRVERDQVLGFVEPLLGAAEIAQLQALSLEFDLRTLEVVRAMGEAQARLRFAERERERIGTLRVDGLSTRQQLDQADQNLAVARSEDEAARATKESLDRMLAKRAQTEERGADMPLRFSLRAPIAGTIVAASHAAGESVAADEEVFRILDPTRVWIEGRISEFDLSRASPAHEATITLAALPGKRFAVGGAHGSPYFGPMIDPASRTLDVRYALENPASEIKAGMLAEIAIATSKADAPVAIPVDAVVMDQGMPTAYVMLEGELFQKRDLELGVTDGGFSEVVRGIRAGERVATRGAYVIKLAAQSPASFGAGHAH